MSVKRQPISLSQLAELLGVEPARLLAIEIDRRTQTAALVLDPEA